MTAGTGLSAITTELMAHADGRPIAYTDATGIAVFAYQQPDHTYVIEIHTRDDTVGERLCLLLDGEPLCPARRDRTLPPPVAAPPSPLR